MRFKESKDFKDEDELLKSSEESQSEDDEDGWKLTEGVEKEFYKTLSQIKNKDPNIYKKDVEFFKDVPNVDSKSKKKTKSIPLTLRDYERKIIVEKGGELSDEELSQDKQREYKEPTYIEEQESIKNSLKAVLNSDSDSDEDDWGGLFKKREKTCKDKVEEEKEEEVYKKWLKGNKDNAPDEEIKDQMKPLRDFWTNPNIEEEDKFLRDYILNKKYLKNDEDDTREDRVEVIEESDKEEERYKHRYEEPDQEFIKRYPRVMENSVRRKKDHRKQKRDEVKERKAKEKEKKMVEVKLKKKLKKQEIEDKIEELKKLTGNDQLAFDNVINQDFNLDEHEKAMKRLFSEEFYSLDDPSFNPGSCNVEEEDWNQDWCEDVEGDYNQDIHCEDPNFNMDCDFDPLQKKPKEKSSRSRRRKDKHRRTTVSEVVNQEKPVFDPTAHKSFQEYVDQYYSIDCEDFIGDMPCRFKYRRTVPNSYGLTIEEILAADEKELERWSSIKRVHQLRPEHKDKCDLKVYQRKAADEELKRKILPSLFKKSGNQITEVLQKKKNKKEYSENENKEEDSKKQTSITIKVSKEDKKPMPENKTNITKSNKNDNKEEGSKKQINTNEKESKSISETNEKKKKSKNKKKKVNQFAETKEGDSIPNKQKRKLEETDVVNKKRRKVGSQSSDKNLSLQSKKRSLTKKSYKHKESSIEESSLSKMSDARLLAYGIKPKKFRNRLKYNQSTP